MLLPQVLLIENAQVCGTVLLLFKVLPNINSLWGIIAIYGCVFVPSVMNLVRQVVISRRLHRKLLTRMTGIVSAILSIAIQVAVYVAMCYNNVLATEKNFNLATTDEILYFASALFLVSLGWTECFISSDIMCLPVLKWRRKIQRTREKLNCFLIISKCAIFYFVASALTSSFSLTLTLPSQKSFEFRREDWLNAVPVQNDDFASCAQNAIPLYTYVKVVTSVNATTQSTSTETNSTFVQSSDNQTSILMLNQTTEQTSFNETSTEPTLLSNLTILYNQTSTESALLWNETTPQTSDNETSTVSTLLSTITIQPIAIALLTFDIDSEIECSFNDRVTKTFKLFSYTCSAIEANESITDLVLSSTNDKYILMRYCNHVLGRTLQDYGLLIVLCVLPLILAYAACVACRLHMQRTAFSFALLCVPVASSFVSSYFCNNEDGYLEGYLRCAGSQPGVEGSVTSLGLAFATWVSIGFISWHVWWPNCAVMAKADRYMIQLDLLFLSVVEKKINLSCSCLR